MFKNPFSFDGRIRRLEYGISYLLYFTLGTALDKMLNVEEMKTDLVVFVIIAVPMMWFFFAQRSKRCHDLNNNGWWQFIPFYGL
ncbi:MAG: DUF805 domain-containing protein [Bacteroidota bacterium]